MTGYILLITLGSKFIGCWCDNCVLLPVVQAKEGLSVTMKFIDLFADLGGFHQALVSFGAEYVIASKINSELFDLNKQIGLHRNDSVPACVQVIIRTSVLNKILSTPGCGGLVGID